MVRQKNNILVYPTAALWGGLSSLDLFFGATPLYADGVLNLYYLAMSILVGTNGHGKRRTLFFQLHGVPKRNCLNGLLLFAVSWAAIWALLHFLYQQQYCLFWIPWFPPLRQLPCGGWLAKVENLAWIVSTWLPSPQFFKGFMLLRLCMLYFTNGLGRLYLLEKKPPKLQNLFKWKLLINYFLREILFPLQKLHSCSLLPFAFIATASSISKFPSWFGHTWTSISWNGGCCAVFNWIYYSACLQ